MNHPRTINPWLQQQKQLSDQIESCLVKGTPPEINLSIPKHTATAPVLRQFVYNSKHKGKTIPIVFRDSSRLLASSAFAVGILSDGPTVPTDGMILNLGLCSNRHLEIDSLVDLYLMRSKDFNVGLSMAEEEEKTFRRTVEVLSDDEILDGCQIRVFHTGLEPMVVGFYRGVVNVLMSRQRKGLSRKLVVTPWLYAPDNTSTTDYESESLGTKLESYTTSTPWW